MGLLICDTCGHVNGIPPAEYPHVCKMDDIKKHVAQLEQDRRTAESNFKRIRDAVQEVLVLSPLNAKEAWASRLFRAAELDVFSEAGSDLSLNDFAYRYYVLFYLYVDAASLFDHRLTAAKQDMLTRVGRVYKWCQLIQKSHGYEEMQGSVDEFVQALLDEKG